MNVSYPNGCTPFFMFEFTPNNNNINECVPWNSWYNEQVTIDINIWWSFLKF
jgi:hypothetical protein